MATVLIIVGGLTFVGFIIFAKIDINRQIDNLTNKLISNGLDNQQVANFLSNFISDDYDKASPTQRKMFFRYLGARLGTALGGVIFTVGLIMIVVQNLG